MLASPRLSTPQHASAHHGAAPSPQVGVLASPFKEDSGLTIAETRAHFGAWAIVSSPLTLSHDPNNQTIMDAIWPIISNKEVLAVNQVTPLSDEL